MRECVEHNWQMTASATAAPIIRSDRQPELRRLLQNFPTLRQYDFVYAGDPHFLKMRTWVMPTGLNRLLQDYARSTTVILTVKLGSGFAMIVGGHVIYALAALVC